MLRYSFPFLKINQTKLAVWPVVAFAFLSLAWNEPAHAQPLPPTDGKQSVRVRFIDSATGYAVQPETVVTKPQQSGGGEKRFSVAEIERAGQTVLPLESGRHTIATTIPGYQPMCGEFEMTANNPFNIDFYLDPLVEPREVQPDYIISLHRENQTVFVGFVVDEKSGTPLPDVAVNSNPSGAKTLTDARGYFQLYVPVQTDAEAKKSPASLVFEKPGYRAEEHQHLELWSNGDWTYCVRLMPGEGREVVDERTQRRRVAANEAKSSPATNPDKPDSGLVPAPSAINPKSTLPANATVRVPRNIRVLKSDNVTIDYVTMDYYCKHVLPSEWIASWGSINPGGSNCLNAGAVALRSYAISKINAASGSSTYDICATTACQVYGTTTSANTDNACNFTANYVVINSSGVIPAAEYSAENNSAGFSCGDSWTQPTGGCIFDPVCSGETRAGHGRGMCQWGTAKWATGRKMGGNVTGDTTPNGYPRRDWVWIVQHYYPNLTLVKGAPLVIGDDVKAMEVVNVNQCVDGSITNGYNCPLLGTVATATTGVIVDGPTVVTNDGKGFTWYRVQWNDAGSTLGWSKENYIERFFPLPTAPASLNATAVATNQINLAWTDTANVETGFTIERGNSANGPWTELGLVAANATSYSDKNLYPGSTWHYRVRAYNAGGNSGYSSITNATTPNTAVTFPAIGNKNVTEGATLTFTNTASAADFVRQLSDIQNFTTDETNGAPLFRNPRFSTSTSANLDPAPDFSVVTDVFTTNGHGTGLVLRVSCDFTNAANPWLRLTTAGAASWPNPVIVLTNKLRFDIFSDKTIQVAVGLRETATAVGAPVGSDGGTTGGIEWTGVINVVGGVPQPNRSLAANNWTTLTFNFPTEPVANFSGGNGILSTASGLGVLEHLAIVPTGGTGIYNIYLDNFAVLMPRTFTYTLGAGAPGNASVNAVTGVFNWSPTEAQGPVTNVISMIVTDNSVPPLSVTNTFTVIVGETNSAPLLTAIADRTVHAGTFVTFTNLATDADVPTNLLTFSLDAGSPVGATVGTNTGIFSWQTDDAHTGTTNSITVRVTDNGVPPMDNSKAFTVAVLARPMIQNASISGANFALTWSAIPGTKYRVQFKNNLEDPAWTSLALDVTAGGATASITDPLGAVQRFYRILVVGP